MDDDRRVERVNKLQEELDSLPVYHPISKSDIENLNVPPRIKELAFQAFEDYADDFIQYFQEQVDDPTLEHSYHQYMREIRTNIRDILGFLKAKEPISTLLAIDVYRWRWSLQGEDGEVDGALAQILHKLVKYDFQ